MLFSNHRCPFISSLDQSFSPSLANLFSTPLSILIFITVSYVFKPILILYLLTATAFMAQIMQEYKNFHLLSSSTILFV